MGSLFARFVLVLLLMGGVAEVRAQSKTALPSEQRAAREADALQQAMDQHEAQQHALAGTAATDAPAARTLSFRNFVRGGMATGNLIQVPYVTNVNIAAGYWGGTVQPNKIQWPRNSGVEYGHTMSFIVAGEVVNDAGDTLRIASDSYNRSGGDQAPSGSHKYFFNAVPGFYNMQGDRGTANQLNNNADDRQTLEEAGYYFVGGLNEDVNGNGELEAGEDLNNDGTLNAELQNLLEYTAQSNVPETWPAFWPPQSYVGDDRPPCAFEQGTTCDPGPGVRAGRWNGAYGAFVRADQEAYYVADDRDNDEFEYYPFLNPATGEPDRRAWEDGGRRGLGVEAKVRQYQWASVLAEDIFIATLDVKNVSRKDIPRATIAMIVDYDIADQTGDNEAFFDTEDDITYQWLKRDLTINGFKVGYGGVGFLESPGLEGDGADNDGDGMTDEDRADGVDNDGDWRAWTDVDADGQHDNEDANNNFVLDDGEDVDGDGSLTIEPLNDDVGSDGLGPESEGYPGPDPDGTEANGRPDPGEPNFEFTDNDEIDQIGLTGMVIRTPADFDRDLDDDRLFWDEYIQPGLFVTPTETADIIYVYSSGVTSIAREQEQRFSIAFFCGNDFQDMLRNKRTMQNIYDSDYNFARPPRTPFLTAVPGDERVTLVWDQSAEASRDPIYGFDFEMYKVYRSTDPEFNTVKTITDAFGNPLLWEPLHTPTGDKVQFDLANGLAGAHPVPVEGFGVSYDMGSDTGLEYSYVDSTVDNGRTYYYAVVSVDQGYHTSFYERGISAYQALAEISPTESSKIIEVDAFDRPTHVDRNAAVVVPQPPALGYVEPQLADGVRRESGNATGQLQVDFLLPDEANSQGYDYEFTFTDDGSLEALDPEFLSNGLTTGFTLRRLGPDGAVDTLATVHRETPSSDLFASDVLRARTYDGMRFTLDNAVRPEPVRTEWLPNEDGPRDTRRPRAAVAVDVAEDATRVPHDYEIRVAALGADTSNSLSPLSRIPTNFSITDVTDLNMTRVVPFQLTEASVPPVPGDTVRGTLSPGDVVNVRVGGVDFSGYRYYAQSTWRFRLGVSEQGAAALGSIDDVANAIYDSLAVWRVRGLERQPFGPDLDRQELIPFFEQIQPWYASVLDSLAALPGLRDILHQVQMPEEYLGTLRTIAAHELPAMGDAFVLETSKPFDRDDVLRFTVDGHRMQEDVPESSLEDIYVVPDPYVAVSSLEARNVQLSGRGERRIDFRNLPPQCTIRIFTMSGRLVKVIEHQGASDRSIASWNLQSDDGLDVSYGVYIYHVDAPGIGERVGRFAIIK